jgi:hypothetical protein
MKARFRKLLKRDKPKTQPLPELQPQQSEEEPAQQKLKQKESKRGKPNTQRPPEPQLKQSGHEPEQQESEQTEESEPQPESLCAACSIPLCGWLLMVFVFLKQSIRRNVTVATGLI